MMIRNDTKDHAVTPGRARRGWWGVVMSGLLLSACDLSVDNPTMIEDTDLNDPKAIAALAAGVAGDYAEAMVNPGGGGLITAGAMLSDELVHVGTWVGLRGLSDGQSLNTWQESNSRWSVPSRARWTAEQAITRISDVLTQDGQDPSTSPEIASVTMWAGHANRVMGDHFCNAVINGGPLEPHTVYYERAEKYFTDALAVAEAADKREVRLSSLAGRAHVNMMQGDWDAAVADAQQVPTNFVYHELHHDAGREQNDIYWWGYLRNETSVWGTPFAEWGVNRGNPDAQGDPRVPYDEFKKGGDGRRPFFRQLKFGSYSDDIAVVKGTEMRLIEAEAALVRGDVATTVAKINEVRRYRNEADGYTLPMVSAASVEEAWTLLMKERGLELWLEGKRLADLRRWAKMPGYVPFEVVRREAVGQPASADPWLNVLDTEVMKEKQDMCIMVSKQEYDANPNF